TKTARQVTLSLRSGVYELELLGAPRGLQLSIGKATLTRGETVLATIERVARPAGTKAPSTSSGGPSAETVGLIRSLPISVPHLDRVAHHPFFSEDGRLFAAPGSASGPHPECYRIYEPASGRLVA